MGQGVGTCLPALPLPTPPPTAAELCFLLRLFSNHVGLRMTEERKPQDGPRSCEHTRWFMEVVEGNGGKIENPPGPAWSSPASSVLWDTPQGPPLIWMLKASWESVRIVLTPCQDAPGVFWAPLGTGSCISPDQGAQEEEEVSASEPPRTGTGTLRGGLPVP